MTFHDRAESGDDNADVGPWEPGTLAELAAALPRPVLVAFDVDGTLAPLVTHPSSSELLPGVDGALRAMAGVPGVIVALVSGRPWNDLVRQFGFGPPLVVVGSHGLEIGRPGLTLDAAEQQQMARLSRIAGAAAAQAPGAWIEHKPAGLALHVRQAPSALRAATLTWFVDRLRSLDLAAVLPGHDVVDVALRPYDKGAALDRLRGEHRVASVVFVGDDVTDEHAFSRLGADDLSIKVGPGLTVARFRLADPQDAADFAGDLAARLAGAP